MEELIVLLLLVLIIILTIILVCLLAIGHQTKSNLLSLKYSINNLARVVNARNQESSAPAASCQSSPDTAPLVTPVINQPSENIPEVSVPQFTAPPKDIPAPVSQPEIPIVVVPVDDIPVAVPLPSEPAPAPASPVIQEETAERLSAVSQESTIGEETTQDAPAANQSASQFSKRFTCFLNWIVTGRGEGIPQGESAEKYLATTWLLRAGILVILFTSAFLLKLSIERGLLGPAGRVALSYVAGIALLLSGLSRRMRERYWGIGQTFIGLSIALFYFSSFAMSAMYHLTPVMVSGAVMVFVTVASGLLALKFNAISLALVAMTGGYATPLMLSTGHANFEGLGAYFVLLGLAIIWLSDRRDWKILNWLSMLATYVIFGLAISKYYSASQHYVACQVSLVAFLLIFSLTTFIYNFHRRLDASPSEVVSLLTNSSLFFALSYTILRSVNGTPLVKYAPLTIGLAAFYLINAILLQKHQHGSNRNLLLTFCCLSAIYLSLAFPVIFSARWWPTSWALQGIVLIWFGMRMRSTLLRSFGWLLFFCAILRLLAWDHLCLRHPGYLGLEADFWLASLRRCLNVLLPAGALFYGAGLYLKQARDESSPVRTLFEIFACVFYVIIGMLITFIFTTYELNHILVAKMPQMAAGGRSLLWAIYGFSFLFYGLKKSYTWLRCLGLLLLAVVVGKVFLMDLNHLEAIYRVISFLVFGILLIASAFIYFKFWHNKEEEHNE